MVHFKELPDDWDEDDLNDVVEDVRGDSISLTRLGWVTPAPSKELLNLKKTAQRPHHPWPLEQLLHNLAVVFGRFVK